MAVMTRQEAFGRWFRAQFPDAESRPTAFAVEHGLSHATILNYVGGKTAPRRSEVAEIAEKLGVSARELWVAAGHPTYDAPTAADAGEPGPPRRFARVVEGVSISAGPDALWMTGSIELPPDVGERADYILVVRISGDCLSPEIESGEYVYVDSSRLNPSSGAKIVIRKEDGETMVKRVVDMDGVRLLIDNHGRVYQPNGGQVLGTVVGVVKIEPRR